MESSNETLSFSLDFIDKIPLVVIGFDSFGHVVFWNKEAERITGYTSQEVLYMTPPGFLSDLFVSIGHDEPADRSKFFVRSSRTERLKNRETTILTKKGEVKVLIWNEYTVEKEKDRLPVKFVLTGLDVTNQAVSEKTLRDKERYIKSAKDRLKKYRTIDPQTGLYNYRYFMDLLNRSFEGAVAENRMMSILLIHVDYFNSINNTHGLAKGDMVLCRLSHLIKKHIDRTYMPARFGGAEFAVLMPDTDVNKAFRMAGALFSIINTHEFRAEASDIPVNITTCMSVAGYPYCGDVFSPAQLLDRAVHKLEEAKKAGGNSVMICSPLQYKEHQMTADDHMAVYGDEFKYTMEFVNALSNAVKTKDFYTREHSAIMSNYAADIADYLGMEEHDIMNVRMGCLLHDIGKIGIDRTILQKPAALTAAEFAIIKQHPRIGAEIIRNVHPLKDVVPCVLYHHEKYDGSGYQDGLRGDEIPLGARIISLADVFQAVTSDRPYRKALPEKTAFTILREGSGKHFDPKVVDAFFKVYKATA
ncbi:MAG TPA: diguanylate cyclase [Candidatus Omnitrophota bacterium]|nr:diguanylate cyclase [Candidatus Omnitrophota bacterium]HPS21069.1 diguanylate cyclase [Candidatus Omnitrophota bacterium]